MGWPQIFRWDKDSGRFVPNDAKYTAFRVNQVKIDMEALQRWDKLQGKDSEAVEQLSQLVFAVANDLKWNGGKDDVPEFLSPADAKLLPLIAKVTDERAKQYAVSMRLRVREMVGAPKE